MPVPMSESGSCDKFLYGFKGGLAPAARCSSGDALHQDWLIVLPWLKILLT
jgi:hypothetical protein